jgi:hypothetical protein
LDRYFLLSNNSSFGLLVLMDKLVKKLVSSLACMYYIILGYKFNIVLLLVFICSFQRIMYQVGDFVTEWLWSMTCDYKHKTTSSVQVLDI